MISIPDELHLLLTLGLNAALWWGAFRFVRRFRIGDRFSIAADAMLLSFLVQYAVVAIPGVIGILSAKLIVIATIILIAAMFFLSSGKGKEARKAGALPTIMLWLVLGYLGGIIYSQSSAPPLGDDGMIYHMPAAVQWLKTGWMGIFHTWFVNPANTYSPLGGSTFVAFLIAPMNSDIAARLVQMPALVMIFFAMIELLRGMGVRVWIAAILGAGAVMCRPFLSQAMLVKDDLFLAAFFLAFVGGCSKQRLQDRLGPCRLGVALGLMLAMKYTAILALPLLVLLVDAPMRAKWKVRDWAIFLACLLTIASPWYLRNWIITGNPIFPIPVAPLGVRIFQGLFTIAKSTEMASVHGVWEAFTGKYHDVSRFTLITLIGLCVAAGAIRWRSLIRDPLPRVCILGSLIGLAIFIFASHAAEIRYTYASLLLLFAAAMLVGDWRVQTGVAVSLLLISLATAWADRDVVIQLGVASILVSVIAGAMHAVTVRFGPRPFEVVMLLFLVTGGVLFYVRWQAFHVESDKLAGPFWANRYGSQGELWEWTRDHLPQDAKIATSNMVLPYPLYGRRFTREVVYLPTRRNLTGYHDLPRDTIKLTDQQIRPWVAKQLADDPDWDRWMNGLRTSGMQFLYVERQVANPNPIEIDFANAHPERFREIFRNEAGAVYEIVP